MVAKLHQQRANLSKTLAFGAILLGSSLSIRSLAFDVASRKPNTAASSSTYNANARGGVLNKVLKLLGRNECGYQPVSDSRSALRGQAAFDEYTGQVGNPSSEQRSAPAAVNHSNLCSWRILSISFEDCVNPRQKIWNMVFHNAPQSELNQDDSHLMRKLLNFKNHPEQYLEESWLCLENFPFYQNPEINYEMLSGMPGFQQQIFALPWPLDETMKFMSFDVEHKQLTFFPAAIIIALNGANPILKEPLYYVEISRDGTNSYVVSPKGPESISSFSPLDWAPEDCVFDRAGSNLIIREKVRCGIPPTVKLVYALGTQENGDIFVVSDFTSNDSNAGLTFDDNNITKPLKFDRDNIQINMLFAEETFGRDLKILQGERIRDQMRQPRLLPPKK